MWKTKKKEINEIRREAERKELIKVKKSQLITKIENQIRKVLVK